MPATMTLIGLYNYDPTIFDLMTLPSGIDKEQVKDNILIQSSDFEVLYPDSDFLKVAVKRWADKWYFTFDKWIKALAIEYDPLNNYDRYEEYEDTGKETRADSGSSAGTTTSGGTTQHDISAYDSSTMREDTKDTTSASGSDSTTSSSSGSTDTSLKHTAHLYGNIGVTTSQQMLEAELQVARFNLVDQITDCFLNEFCIRVY